VVQVDVGRRLPLVERIYEIAVAPSRLEALLDAWAERLRAEASVNGAFTLLAAPDLLPHIEQVEAALRAAVEAGEVGPLPAAAVWVERLRSAAFVVSRDGAVTAVNSVAAAVFGLTIGGTLDPLDLEPDDLALLLQQITVPQNAGPGNLRLVRLRRAGQSTPVVMRLEDNLGDHGDLIGIVTTVLAWPDRLTAVMRAMFGLTGSEVAVVEDIVLGRSVKEIAARSARSVETVRSHVAAVLDKTDTRSQAELIRMTLGLLEVVARPRAANGGVPHAALTANGNAYATIILGDGRRLDYLVIGSPRGRPFALMPSSIGLTRLPRRDEQALVDRGLRMIVPVRAGFGRSSPLPRGRHVYDVTAADTTALMDHLAIESMPFLTINDDFRIAVEMTTRAPGRIAAILACGAPMPTVTADHYARMTKWARFIKANACHAPKALPYVALAFFNLAKRVGSKRFLQTVMAESPADLRLLDDDAIMDAMIRGSEIVISPAHVAHAAWAAEVAANHSGDWSETLRSCGVPITLFHGHQDPFCPFETTRDFVATMPHLRLVAFPECGQLLYPHLATVFHAIEAAMVPAGNEASVAQALSIS
jgi:pimeloyl-ACP methyl ester carboxylesterase/DNA-binding CsgD family transcriptional regulator